MLRMRNSRRSSMSRISQPRMKEARVLRLAVPGVAAARVAVEAGNRILQRRSKTARPSHSVAAGLTVDRISRHRSRDRRSRSVVLRAVVEAGRTVMVAAADLRRWRLAAEVDRKVAEVVLRPEPVVDLRAAAAAARTAAAVVEAVATAAATAKGNANNYQNTTE